MKDGQKSCIFYNLEEGSSQADRLVKMLKINNSVTTLSINDGNHPFAVTWEELTNAFIDDGCSELVLYCSANDAEKIISALKTNSSITNLEFDYKRISITGANNLSDVLKNNSKITNLRVECKRIDVATSATIVNAIKTNTSITNLSIGFSSGKSCAVSIEQLFDALKTNSTIDSLEVVDRSEIDDRTAAAIIDMLKTNSSIASLKFTECLFGDGEIKNICDIFKTNSTITSLAFCEYSVDDADMKEILEILKINSFINDLSFVIADSSNIVNKITEIAKVNSSYDSLVVMSDKRSNNDLHISISREQQVYKLHREKNLELVKELASDSTLINKQDPHGRTPLHCACIADNAEKIKLLIQQQADLTIKDLKGKKPLDYSNNAETIMKIAKFIFADEQQDKMVDSCQGYVESHNYQIIQRIQQFAENNKREQYEELLKAACIQLYSLVEEFKLLFQNQEGNKQENAKKHLCLCMDSLMHMLYKFCAANDGDEEINRIYCALLVKDEISSENRMTMADIISVVAKDKMLQSLSANKSSKRLLFSVESSGDEKEESNSQPNKKRKKIAPL